MSKLFVAVLAFSTVSLAVAHQGFNLDVFLNNPKIKVLSHPDVKGAYPGDDTNYDDLLKALARLRVIGVQMVKEVLKEHAPKLYQRVKAAEKAFEKVRDSIGDREAKNVVDNVGDLIEKYYLVGLLINDQAREVERLHKLYDGLNDKAKKVVDEKLQDAAKAVEKALYRH